MKKMSGAVWGVVGGLVLLALLWGFFVEPNILTVTKKTLSFTQLPKELDGLRIVLFADVHAGPRYSAKGVERVARMINEQEPDLILFAGDLLHREESAAKLDAPRIAAALGSLHAPLGKYAVLGNHDVWSARTEEIAKDILSQGGFVLLDNESRLVADKLTVAGTRTQAMTDYIAFRPEPQKAVHGANGFVILLSHEPDQFLENCSHPFDLQLSGHSHGGQVSLPLIGSILLPVGGKKFPYGEYERDGHRLFVTRGIGTSILKVRFLTPPEIVVLTLQCT